MPKCRKCGYQFRVGDEARVSDLPGNEGLYWCVSCDEKFKAGIRSFLESIDA
jgi:hypothetical protein